MDKRWRLFVQSIFMPASRFFPSLFYVLCHLFRELLHHKVYAAATSVRCPQGSPMQEERNGPLPPTKPQEPSLNHTAPAPGELSAAHVPFVGLISYIICANSCLWERE